jgi:TonB family protein
VHLPIIAAKACRNPADALSSRCNASVLALCVCSALAHAQAQAPAAEPALTPPAVVQRTEAAYPQDALAARQEASVTLLVTVAIDGSVSDVAVTETGGESFDAAAIEAVKQWKFMPARRGTELVVSRIRIPFRFALPPVETVPVAATPVQEAASDASSTVGSSAATGGETAKSPAGSAAPSADVKTPPSAQGEAAAPEEAPIDVTVYGRPRPASRGTSDFQLEVGSLATVPRKNAAEMLKLAPGVMLTNEGGEAHADQVFLRGFDAREGQDIEFSAAGVPINEAGNLHGNGYADTHFIIPELVSSLRIVEGPFDPRQGNFAVAGSADYELGLDERGLTLKQTLGSFGTTRTLLLWGPGAESKATFAGVELYQTDGFGENRDGQRASVMTQYEGHAGPHTYRLGVTAYIASFHTAGVLREDDYQHGRVGFFDTYDSAQGEDASRYSASAELESHFGRLLVRNQLFAVVRPLRVREDFTGFLLDPQEPMQQPHEQRGDLIDLASQGQTLGARGSARLSEPWLGNTQELELGYFARGDSVNATQQRIEASTGHPYHLDTDLDSKLGDIGLYADLNLRATSWLAVRGGVRGDLFTYDVLDNCAVQSVAHPSRTNPQTDASCLSQQQLGAYREPTQRVSTVGTVETPHVSLIVGPVYGLGAAASYGRGVRSVDPIYVSQDAKTPFASVDAVEGGLFYSRKLGAAELSARSTLFQTRVDRDLIFSETAGRNVLGGATTRTGSANAIRVTGSFYDAAANFTYVKAVFKDSGLLIPYIPDLVARFDGALFDKQLWPALNPTDKPLRGTISSGVSYVAPRPLPQGERGNPIFTLDLNATLGWSMFELGLACTNLFDNRYRIGEYNYASDFHSEPFPTLVPVRHFSAGAPRAFFVTLALRLGGES